MLSHFYMKSKRVTFQIKAYKLYLHVLILIFVQQCVLRWLSCVEED